MKKMYKKLEKLASNYVDMLIKRMRDIESQGQWQKPWFPVRRRNFIPQNIRGNRYSGGNVILLLIGMMFSDFRTPIFLTYKQAQEYGLKVIRKGCFYVYHFNYMYVHRLSGETINEKDYKELSEAGQEQYLKRPIAKQYHIFNLDQTDFQEKFPEQYASYLNHFSEEVRQNTDADSVRCLSLDKMLYNKEWVCPIELKKANTAFYDFINDMIITPPKNQYPNPVDFYAVLLHEMAHSTGIEERLNRKIENEFESPEYAREELVAELSSALCGYYLGFETTIRDNHIQYIRYWIKVLSNEPTILFEILSDIVKCVKYITERIGFELPETVSVEVKSEKQEVSGLQLVE